MSEGAAALNELAERMGEMSAQERSEAAAALRQQAAQAAATDPNLAQALQAMANAMEAGDQAAAEAAAQQ
nr:hypothetical protein [Ardenticatenales bacterium]